MTTTESAAAGSSASTLGVGADALSCRDCGRRLRGSKQLRYCGRCTHARQVAETQAKTDEEERMTW